MTRDNFLFTICGLLAGFILGYFVAPGGRAAAPAPAAPPPGSGTDAALAPSSAEAAAHVREVREAVARDPGNPDLNLQLANALYDASDWKGAAEAYEKALPTKGTDPNMITDLGSCYRNLGKFDKALEMYQKAQQIQPSHAQSLLNMTLVYAFDLKDAAKAQTALDRLKKEHPEIPRLNDLQMRISELRASKS
ncbi:MAG TPA: tetratricopeptide repeat protein [Thermoanaerobaculia bacterium]|nr:tetratricopeptide repeat protein [Thermoanaerobaculia bacterium]